MRGISQKKSNAFCRKRKKSLTVCSMDSVSEALLALGLPLYCCWDLWSVGSPPPVPANERSAAHPTSCALNQLRSRPLFHNILRTPRHNMACGGADCGRSLWSSTQMICTTRVQMSNSCRHVPAVVAQVVWVDCIRYSVCNSTYCHACYDSCHLLLVAALQHALCSGNSSSKQSCLKGSISSSRAN